MRHFNWVVLCGALACTGAEEADTDAPSAGTGGQVATNMGGSAGGSQAGQGGGSTLNGGAGGSPSAGSGGSSAQPGGAGGDSNGGEGGAAGQQQASDPCPKPPGTDVVATRYVPPETAQGCVFDGADRVSATLDNEADFSTYFDCAQGATSGIDFSAQRLRVSVVLEAGFVAPTLAHVVLEGGVVHVGLELPVYCGGAFPPTAVVLTLLPSGSEGVEDDVCRSGSCGAGGFPP